MSIQTMFYRVEILGPSLRAQTALCGAVALLYGGGVDSEVPQLHITQSAPSD